MTYTDANKLIVGECRQVMRSLPAGIVHCCVTSPPYWGLRDYGLPPVEWADGWHGCYGLEPTPEMFIAHTVEVFREVKRILRDDGVLWLNIGDSYAQSGRGGIGDKSTLQGGRKNQHESRKDAVKSRAIPSDMKPGDLCNIPHRVAAALQADGWFWRSTIIWAKRSPMPESVSGWRWVKCRVKIGRQPVAQGGLSSWDMGEHSHGASSGEYRGQEKTVPKYESCPGCGKCKPNGGYVLRRGKWRPTTAHEYVFLFSKTERYFCDGDAVQEMATGSTSGRISKDRGEFSGKYDKTPPKPGREAFRAVTVTRNPRSVWTLSSEPFKGAHFATFPTMLAKRCIEAGTSAGGCCGQCGSPYAPIVESERVPTRPGVETKCLDNGKPYSHNPESPYLDQMAIGNRDPQRHIAVTRITGYRPTCGCSVFSHCDESEHDCTGCTGKGKGECGAVMVSPKPAPCLVFDPFAGSGTTLQTARALGRSYLGSELSEKYAELARERIETLPKWAEKNTRRARVEPSPTQLAMF